MLLQDHYYSFVVAPESTPADGQARYTVRLLPDCDLYRGHFPGHPVCPGICNVELLRECAMKAIGQSLHIAAIKKCRFTKVATPQTESLLTADLSWQATADGFALRASLSHEGSLYVEMEATMKP
jgi:3-hydroxyacyl-[acyl-carrier-protein] dehydratase